MSQELGSMWENCPHVERIPGKVGGAWVFKGTRFPLAIMYANLASDQTINSLVKNFPDLDPEKVREVLEFEARAIDEDRLVAGQKPH